MKVVIREDIDKYMDELKSWLLETRDVPLEEMDSFFSARIDGYEEHMQVWKDAYVEFAGLVPKECGHILDLGCGTGLELDRLWEQLPDIKVTGVDLCQSMLDKLVEKHPDRCFEAVCMDYFAYDFGVEKWDAVISFESLHHFLPEQKKILYRRIFKSLNENTKFIIGDYIACCGEEEELLRRTYFEKKRSFNGSPDEFVHFDIPLTLAHEIKLLKEAGFASVEAAGSIEGATMITAEK